MDLGLTDSRVLITNVGFNTPDFFLQTDPAIWDNLIATNLTSVMSCVRANLVAPGLTLPEDDQTLGEQSLWRQGERVMNAAQTDYVVKATPLRRLTKADDIANSVAFLASYVAARQITGQLITVSGGFAMR